MCYMLCTLGARNENLRRREGDTIYFLSSPGEVNDAYTLGMLSGHGLSRFDVSSISQIKDFSSGKKLLEQRHSYQMLDLATLGEAPEIGGFKRADLSLSELGQLADSTRVSQSQHIPSAHQRTRRTQKFRHKKRDRKKWKEQPGDNCALAISYWNRSSLEAEEAMSRVRRRFGHRIELKRRV